MATRMGLPACCAAAKDPGSKVFVSAANAGAARAEMVATVAKSTERRECIVKSSSFVGGKV
jgi:hypothetical protein